MLLHLRGHRVRLALVLHQEVRGHSQPARGGADELASVAQMWGRTANGLTEPFPIRRTRLLALNRSAVGSPRIGKCAQSTHSLTRAKRSVGNDNPSLASAVRLTLKVNCVGPAIGRSAGFAPRRILSTY